MIAQPEDPLWVATGGGPTSYPYDPTTRLVLGALIDLAETASALADEVGLPTRQADMDALADRLVAALCHELRGPEMGEKERP